jgi:hypothetical protein
MPLDNNLREASKALSKAQIRLSDASKEANDTEHAEKHEYELALLSEEVLDINNRLLAIMHSLKVPH